MSIYKLAEELKINEGHIKTLKFMFISLEREGKEINDKIETGKNLITLGRALKDDLKEYSEEKKVLEEFIESTNKFKKEVIEPAKELQKMFEPLFKLFEENGMD